MNDALCIIRPCACYMKYSKPRACMIVLLIGLCHRLFAAYPEYLVLRSKSTLKNGIYCWVLEGNVMDEKPRAVGSARYLLLPIKQAMTDKNRL